jgi:hypothetical protein
MMGKPWLLHPTVCELRELLLIFLQVSALSLLLMLHHPLMMLETFQIQMKRKKRTNVAILKQKQLMMRLTLLKMKGGKSPEAFM